MSPSRRDSYFANSGVVVAIHPQDLEKFVPDHGPLAALALQAEVEQSVWNQTRRWAEEGKWQVAPAQRIPDFLREKVSSSLAPTSYQPGLVAAPMHEILPDFISKPLQQALPQFQKKMKGYASSDGQIIGLESRTSSPVRIPRHPETLEHPTTHGLFPCGEGAGYAGGIMSAAMDGERCAEALAKTLTTS